MSDVMDLARRAFRDLHYTLEHHRCELASLNNPLESISDHEQYRAVLWDLDAGPAR